MIDTTTLADFLLARIAEDEATAMAAVRWDEGISEWADAGEPDWRHIARWDPARVLVECDVKRRMLALLDEYSDRSPHVPRLTIYTRDIIPKILALPYADHPDYRQEWKP